MLLAKADSEFATGVAVAPVTDLTWYDTHYTERYPDTPQHNPQGYELSGVLHWLDGLKSDSCCSCTVWPTTTCCSRTRPS